MESILRDWSSSLDFECIHILHINKKKFKFHFISILHFFQIAYVQEHLDNLRHSPFVTDTPLRQLHRSTKVLSSDVSLKMQRQTLNFNFKLLSLILFYYVQVQYSKTAKSVMDKYNLITDEPRMKQAVNAMKIISEVCSM